MLKRRYRKSHSLQPRPAIPRFRRSTDPPHRRLPSPARVAAGRRDTKLGQPHDGAHLAMSLDARDPFPDHEPTLLIPQLTLLLLLAQGVAPQLSSSAAPLRAQHSPTNLRGLERLPARLGPRDTPARSIVSTTHFVFYRPTQSTALDHPQESGDSNASEFVEVQLQSKYPCLRERNAPPDRHRVRVQSFAWQDSVESHRAPQHTDYSRCSTQARKGVQLQSFGDKPPRAPPLLALMACEMD